MQINKKINSDIFINNKINMTKMICGCSLLKEVKFFNTNTKNIIYMNGIFE